MKKNMLLKRIIAILVSLALVLSSWVNVPLTGKAETESQSVVTDHVDLAIGFTSWSDKSVAQLFLNPSNKSNDPMYLLNGEEVMGIHLAVENYDSSAHLVFSGIKRGSGSLAYVYQRPYLGVVDDTQFPALIMTYLGEDFTDPASGITLEQDQEYRIKFKYNLTKDADPIVTVNTMMGFENMATGVVMWYGGVWPGKVLSRQWVTKTTRTYYNPVVTSSSDLMGTVGDTIAPTFWTDGIYATWGKTTANTIPSMGQITDTTLVGGTDPQLSSDGVTLNQVGYATHNYLVKDDHSLSTAKQYAGDTTSATASRKIIVRAANAPGLLVNYSTGAVDENGLPLTGTYPAGTWTNQPLDIIANASDSGAYDISVYQDGTAMSPVQATSVTSGGSHTITGYSTESATLSGHTFSAILLGTGDHSVLLSPESTGQIVKIDTTAPTFTTVIPQQTGGGDDDWSRVPGTDAADTLSGLETGTGGLYYKFVSHGAGVPAIDQTWSTDYTTAYGVLTPGDYDLYVYAKDNATNKSAVIKGNPSGYIRVLSHKAPLLTGSTTTITSLPSDAWSNQDVTVLAENPADVDTPPAVLSPHYVDYTDGGDTTTTPPIAAHTDRAATTTGSVSHTYTEETDEITVTGVLVNGAGAALTQPGSYRVKIDKTVPTAAGSLSYISDGHTLCLIMVPMTAIQPVTGQPDLESVAEVCALQSFPAELQHRLLMLLIPIVRESIRIFHP